MDKKTIGLKELTIYGGGGMFTYGFQLLITNYYILYFMTDVLRIPATLAATLNTVIQWIEVGTMPLSGGLIDASRFKKDKYGTWTLIAGVAMGITLPLVYLDLGLPFGAASALLMISYFIMAFAYNVGWTALRALTGVIGKNSADIVALATAANVGGAIPGIFWTQVSAFLFAIPLWANTTNQYAGASLVIGVLIIAGAFAIKGMTAKIESAAVERESASNEKISLRDMLKNLKGSMAAYLFSMAFAAAQGGIFSTLLIYYAQYVLRDPSAAAKSISWASVGSLLGSLIVPPVVNALGEKKAHVFSQVLLCILYLSMFLFTGNSTMFIFLRFLQSILASFYTILLASMAMDIGEYNEMNGVPQAPAFLQSIGGTGIRIGWAIATALASYILAMVGYTPDATATPQIVSAITNGIIFGPAVCAALAAVIMVWYKVDEKAISEYRRSKTTL